MPSEDRPEPGRPVPEATLQRVRTVARVMDQAVSVPGTPIRFGLDAVLGLVPGVGDVAGTVVGGLVLLSAARAGLPASILARMVLNIGIDTVLGAIPLVGDLFDFAWKSNTKNLRLMEQSLVDPRGARRSTILVLLAAFVALGLLVVGTVVVAAWVIRGLLRLIGLA